MESVKSCHDKVSHQILEAVLYMSISSKILMSSINVSHFHYSSPTTYHFVISHHLHLSFSRHDPPSICSLPSLSIFLFVFICLFLSLFFAFLLCLSHFLSFLISFFLPFFLFISQMWETCSNPCYESEEYAQRETSRTYGHRHP